MHRRDKHVTRWSPKDSTGITINDVCEVCNTGWMSDLEAKVRPFLCSMIHGDAATLNEHTATDLTAWIYKIMLLFDRIGPAEHRRFRREHYAAFHAKQIPPSALVAWLAAYMGSLASTATDRGLTFSGGFKGVVATLSFGRVAFQLLIHNLDDVPRVGVWVPQAPLAWADRLSLLWPVVSETSSFSLAWPLARVLDDADLIKLRNRWDRPFRISGGLLS